jgi:hypothetical protein
MVKVTLGKKAGIFHDPSSGITIKKGEIKELSSIQVNNRKIRAALNGGHLVYADVEKKESQINDSKLKENFESMVKSGKDISKIKKAFSLDNLKTIAGLYNVELDENDTKDSILEVIIEEVSSSK